MIKTVNSENFRPIALGKILGPLNPRLPWEHAVVGKLATENKIHIRKRYAGVHF